MSTSEQAAAPAAAADASTQAPAIPPAAATPAPSGDPAWLPARIEQAKRSEREQFLKSLGVESVDALREKLTSAAKLEDEKKTDAQRQAEKLAQLEPEAKRAKELADTIARYAEAELAKLTEAQRQAVLSLAGEDKAMALDAIGKLRPTWSVEAPAPAQAPKPLPASTAPPASAPAPAGTQSTTSHLATHQALEKINPFLAAEYRQKNLLALEQEKQSRG